MAKRHAKGGLARYSPPTRGRGAHLATTPRNPNQLGLRLSAVAGGGLLTTTVLFGLGGFSAPAGAVGVLCVGSASNFGSGNTCVSLGGDAAAGFDNNATGTGSITANGNSAEATTGDAYAGSFGTATGTGSITANGNSAETTSGDAYAGYSNFADDGNLTASDDTAESTSGGAYLRD